MARYSIDGQILTDIGDALREKTLPTGWRIEENIYVATNPGYDSVFPEDIKPKLDCSYTFTVDNFNLIDTDRPTRYGIYLSVDSKSVATIDSNSQFPITFTLEANKTISLSASHVVATLDLIGIPDMDVGIKPEDMADTVSSLQLLPSEALRVTDSCNYKFANNGWNWLIENFGEQITTTKIISASNMFDGSSYLYSIPFDINLSAQAAMSYIFRGCTRLERVPMINVENNKISTSMHELFGSCNNLKEFPEGFAEDWDWSIIDSQTSSYGANQNGMFSNCYSLRKVPQVLISHCNPYANNTSALCYNAFNTCRNLEVANNIAVADKATWSSNAFNNTFRNCERLKEVTFAKQADGTPYVCNGWKKQVIDLSTAGYGISAKSYNTDLTDDTKVDDNLDKYLAYVDGTGNPDGWASAVGWSVFNRKSMVKLINSLPDTSGAASSGNTVKYNWAQGGAIGDEYNMSKLSEAEIAVAAAKGWTLASV